MIQNPKRKTYRTQKPGLVIKLFSFMCICLTFILAIRDKGPPLPPFDDNFSSFDCHSIFFQGYTDREGQIDFRFSTLPSVEYPPEYLPHFLSIQIETGPIKMKYSGDDIENISRTSTDITFSIYHTFAGDSIFTAQCLNNQPQTMGGHLKDIVIHKPQYSTSDNSGIDSAKFHDVCLEYEKFLYFVTISGDGPPVPFDDTTLRFEMLKWPLDAYLNHKKVTVQKKTCYLVAPTDKKPWKLILLTLIPLAISVSKNSPNPNDALFIFRNNVPENAQSALRFLSPNPPVVLDPIMCFPTLLMTATHEKFDKKKKRINEMLDLDLQPLRSKIKRSPILSGKICLAQNLAGVLENAISTAFPDYPLYILKTEETPENAADLVSSSHIFIGDHITSLIHIIWMNPSSHVIDATNKDYACNKWAEKLAHKLGVNYKAIHDDDQCQCQDFDCYLTKVSAATQVDVDKVLDAIRSVIPAR